MRLLGKKPYVHDSRSLDLAKYTTKLPAPPAWVNWALRAKAPWGQMLNDSLGNCTCAAVGHMIQSFTADLGNEVTVSDSAILAAYEAVGRYVPGDPNTDQGAMVSDALKYWQKTGVGNHKISAYAEISPKSHTLQRQAIDLFGGVDIGIQLPLAAQNMGTHWTMDGITSLGGDWAPGSWGGHSVAVLAYNGWSYICVSWGELIRINTTFWDAYTDESWTTISSDFFSGAKSASGFDLAQLQADLAAI